MIPYISLTLAQQGGIGYPPRIVKLDRWYAVSDSRNMNPPAELEPYLCYQRIYPKRDRHWHPQGWVMNKWNNAPQLTWADVLEKARKLKW